MMKKNIIFQMVCVIKIDFENKKKNEKCMVLLLCAEKHAIGKYLRWGRIIDDCKPLEAAKKKQSTNTHTNDNVCRVDPIWYEMHLIIEINFLGFTLLAKRHTHKHTYIYISIYWMCCDGDKALKLIRRSDIGMGKKVISNGNIIQKFHEDKWYT